MDPIGTLHSDEFSIQIDGGSRGNLGPSTTTWIIHDFLGEIVVNAGMYIPFATNNQPEYTALVGSLSDISSLQLDHVVIFINSLLLTHHLI